MVDTSFESLDNVVFKKYYAKSTRPHLLYFFKAFEAGWWFSWGSLVV